jgi:hypothetical protein
MDDLDSDGRVALSGRTSNGRSREPVPSGGVIVGSETDRKGRREVRRVQAVPTVISTEAAQKPG